MRAFLQKKAGATYFSSSNVTANIRKHNLEFIFSLKNGWHAVISVIPTPEGVYVMSCLGTISEELDRIIPTVRLKPGEHNKFTDLLECKSDYRLICIDVDDKGLESGFGKLIEDKHLPHLQLLGDKDIQLEAEKLCKHTLDIYTDLSKSPHNSLKSLTEYFYDR